MKKLLLILLLAIVAFGANIDEFKGEASAKIKFLEEQNKKLEEKIDKIEDKIEDKFKEINVTEKMIDRQDKRIEDINFNFNAATAWIAIILTMLGIALPLIQWRINTKLQEDAKNELKSFKQIVDREIEDVKNHAEKTKVSISTYSEEMLKTNPSNKKTQTTPEEQKTLAKDSKIMSENAKNAQDFIEAARLAYFAQNYGDVFSNIEKALSEKSNPTDEQKAEALFIKGVTLVEANKSEDAIKAYDELILKYKDSFNEAIQVQVASAMFNKGVTLGQLNKSEDAIKVYDDLILKYKDSSNEAIQVQVASAMNNKGVRLGQQNKSEEAKECYLQAIEKKPDYLSAYTNLFEANLILNEKFDTKLVEQFKNYVKDNKQSLLTFNMLQTIQNAKISEQIEQIAKLKQDFSGVDFDDWSWNELENWAHTLDDLEAQKRVLGAIEAFKNWSAF